MAVEHAQGAYQRNIEYVGRTDQGGRADGVQLMVHNGYAYVGHMFADGFSVIDVRDPSKPKPVKFVPNPAGTWSIHLQTHDDLLLVIQAQSLFNTRVFGDEANYYTQSVTQGIGDEYTRQHAAGMRVFDISNPADPREIAFMAVDGIGLHRIWYVGGRYAYVSASLDGYTDYIFLVVDMQDPTNPQPLGKWWIPGMHAAGGEVPSWDTGSRRFGHHHSLVAGDTAYGAWRDGGLVILDVADRDKPELLSHTNWSPPYGGGTHSCLPLPGRDLLLVLDEAIADQAADGIKHIWVVDIREPTNPVTIAQFPVPDEEDYIAKGSHFGPHNFHENRPGSFVSDQIVFATYQNAGVRVFDIGNAARPEQVGVYVPPAPEKMYDPRPGRPQVIQTCDVFVDQNALMYVTDYNAGLYVLEYTGG
jgi:hypothetical protein